MKELLNEIAKSADKYPNLIIQNLAQDFHTSDHMNLQCYKSPIPLSTEHYNDITFSSEHYNKALYIYNQQ